MYIFSLLFEILKIHQTLTDNAGERREMARAHQRVTKKKRVTGIARIDRYLASLIHYIEILQNKNHFERHARSSKGGVMERAAIRKQHLFLSGLRCARSDFPKGHSAQEDETPITT